ncbi:MAG: aldo/keto reductase, partial [Planctomycetota bacterium]
MNRRDFLKTASLSTAALAMDGVLARGQTVQTKPATQSSNAPKLPRREYGRTGIRLSVIGLGGIVVTNTEQKRANRIVAEAVERGVNYFDVAPAYGNAEQILGPALKPFRKNVFLACKTGQRNKEGAQRELKRSLKRLHTDYFDLYQLHAVIDVQKDIDAAFAKGGAMEVFMEAKKSRQIRHLGFSAHTAAAAFAAMDLYDFDSVLFPVNFACFYKGGFGPRIINQAQSKGVARLALKAMARQEWPKNDPQRKKYKKCWYQPITDPHEAELALRFTLSQPVTAAIPPGDKSLFRLAMNL